MDGAYSRCQEILTAQRDKLDAVAHYLLEHETMEWEAFMEVLGERVGGENGAE